MAWMKSFLESKGMYYPSELVMYNTSKCNKKCGNEVLDDVCAMHSNLPKFEDLSEKDSRNLVNAAIEFNLGIITFTGGEPTLNTAPIVEAAKTVAESGRKPKIRIMTNLETIYRKGSEFEELVKANNILTEKKLPPLQICGGIDDFYGNTSPEKMQVIDKNLREGGLDIYQLQSRYISTEQEISTYNLMRKNLKNKIIVTTPLQLIGRAYHCAIKSDLAKKAPISDILKCGIPSSDCIAVGKIENEYVSYPSCCFMIGPQLELGRINCEEFEKTKGVFKQMANNFEKKVSPFVKNKFNGIDPSQQFYSLQERAEPCEICYQMGLG